MKSHDGNTLKEIISKLGMDNVSFGLYVVFKPDTLLKTSESFNLTDNEKRVLKERVELLK